MNGGFVEAAERDQTTWIVLSRADKRNALSVEMLGDLRLAFDQAKADPGIRSVVLTGKGSAFCAGADIEALRLLSMENAAEFANLGLAITAQIEGLGKPVVAMINGHAFWGGAEIALACTMRIAASNAQIGWPEVRLGIMPGWGGTQRLLRHCGRSKTMELCLLGKPMDAQVASDIGLINLVVPPSELEGAVEQLVQQLNCLPPVSMRNIIHSVNVGMDRSQQQALNYETELFVDCCGSEDKVEGTSAFLEKRPPSFNG